MSSRRVRPGRSFSAPDGASPPAAGLWPPPAQGWIAIAVVALLYAGHLLFGGIVSDVALLMDLAAAALLGGALAHPGLRGELLRLKGLEVAGLLFLLVMAVGVWSLTPYVPGGPHPVWSYVGLKGAPTVDRSATIVELVKLLGLACFFLVGAASGARDERARFAVQITVLAGAVFGLWAIVVAATGAIHQTQGPRLEARFLNPNTAGAFFAALFLLSLAVVMRELRAGGRRSWSAYGYGIAAFVLAVALVATASRGAVTAALAGVVAYLLLQLMTGSLKPSRATVAAAAGLLVAGGLLALAGERLVNRLVLSGSDPAERAAIWQAHWQAFLDSPLFGYGLGGFEPVNRSLLTLANFDQLHNLRAPLNLYLQWLEEGGLLAAVPMFLCVAWLIAVTLRGFLRRTRMTGLLAGLLAVDLAILLHGMTDSALQTPSVAAFWAWTLGLQAALAQGSSRR